MHCKPLFIIHGIVETYTGIQKQSALAQKVGMAHTIWDCIKMKFQVSVQINAFLLYNKKWTN